MSDKQIDTELLQNSWIHSHEEDTDQVRVYRPASYKFPPSRGRKGFLLQSGGELTMQKPGATDRRLESAGTWEMSNARLVLSPNGEPSQTLDIESLEPDRLLIAKKVGS